MTSFETFSAWKHLPHRHGDTTRKSENRDETCWSGSPKRAFRTRLAQIFTLGSSKINVFLYTYKYSSWTPKFATPKSMFRARLPSVFITCYKVPRLPSDLHVVTTWRIPDIVIRTKKMHHASKVLRLPRKIELIFWKPGEHSALVTSWKHVAMSKCHACHTKRGCATFETFKSDEFFRTPRGMAIGTSYERWRTNGCATSSKHTLNPKIPRVKREPLLRIRENCHMVGCCIGFYHIMKKLNSYSLCLHYYTTAPQIPFGNQTWQVKISQKWRFLWEKKSIDGIFSIATFVYPRAFPGKRVVLSVSERRMKTSGNRGLGSEFFRHLDGCESKRRCSWFSQIIGINANSIGIYACSSPQIYPNLV